jgi:hypothetical protein
LGFANQVSDDIHITTSSKWTTRRFYHKFSHFKGKNHPLLEKKAFLIRTFVTF